MWRERRGIEDERTEENVSVDTEFVRKALG